MQLRGTEFASEVILSNGVYSGMLAPNASSCSGLKLIPFDATLCAILKLSSGLKFQKLSGSNKAI